MKRIIVLTMALLMAASCQKEDIVIPIYETRCATTLTTSIINASGELEFIEVVFDTTKDEITRQIVLDEIMGDLVEAGVDLDDPIIVSIVHGIIDTAIEYAVERCEEVQIN